LDLAGAAFFAGGGAAGPGAGRLRSSTGILMESTICPWVDGDGPTSRVESRRLRNYIGEYIKRDSRVIARRRNAHVNNNNNYMASSHATVEAQYRELCHTASLECATYTYLQVSSRLRHREPV
jgi:hypothetical protein